MACEYMIPIDAVAIYLFQGRIDLIFTKILPRLNVCDTGQYRLEFVEMFCGVIQSRLW
jgi:hypothetical protein